jgi:Flp pilus assembly protein TadD
LAQNRKALELDPFSPTFIRGYTWLLIHARRFEEAEQECRRLISEGRDPLYVRNQLGVVLLSQRRFQEARAEFEAGGAGGPNPETSEVCVAVVRAVQGERASAEELLQRLQAEAATRYVPATSLVYLYGVLGQQEEAMSALEQACWNREYSLVSAKVSFVFDPIRKHPRFKAVLRELRLA